MDFEYRGNRLQGELENSLSNIWQCYFQVKVIKCKVLLIQFFFAMIK